jgi:hypothetical protein
MHQHQRGPDAQPAPADARQFRAQREFRTIWGRPSRAAEGVPFGFSAASLSNNCDWQNRDAAGESACAKRFRALPPVRAGNAAAAAPRAHTRSACTARRADAVTGAVISCVDCERRVCSNNFSAFRLGRLVGWSTDEAGRWWCTECQLARGRTPPIVDRLRTAADPREPRGQQLEAEFERWQRIDALVFPALVVALVLAAFGLLLLPNLLVIATLH